MKHTVITLIVAIAMIATAALGHPQPARAGGPWYVRTDGSDTACNGLVNASAASAPDCAYATIAKAIGAAAAGDTVHVGAGAYAVAVTVNKAITLQGMNPPDSAEAAIINNTVTVTAAGAIVRQLKIVPGAVGGGVAAVHVGASNVTIADNVVEGLSGSGSGTNKGLYVYRGGAPAITNITLTGNTVRNLSKTGGTLLDGIMIQGVIDGVTVTQNTIENLQHSSARGIDVTVTGSALSIPPRNVMIANNTLRSFSGNGIVVDLTFSSGIYYADASQVTVVENSITNTGRAFWNRDPSHTLNASANWLNSTVPSTVAGRTNGAVDYTPWLNSGADADPATPGFQGDFSALWVDDVTQTGATGRIQEGIDLTTGAAPTVYVATGETYNEAVTLNKPGLTISSQGNVTLAGGPLTLTGGLWVLGPHTLTLAADVVVSGGSDAAMIVADGAGALCKAYNGTGAFTFPIGDQIDTIEYSPAVLDFTVGTFSSGRACVRVTNAKHPSNTELSYLTRFWTVTSSGISGFSAEATFHYTDADVAGEGYEAGLKALKRDGSTWIVGDGVNAAENNFSMTVNSFSDFTAGGPPNPTAVTLAAFDAAPQNNAIRVTWETASELDNVGFNLYRSETVEGPYTLLNAALIPPQNPGTVLGGYYEWLDTDAQPGVVYYKLEALDVKGVGTFYGPVSTAIVNAPTAVHLQSLAAHGMGLPVVVGFIVAMGVFVFSRRRRG